MANFFARYPSVTTTGPTTVQGEGTAGSQTGGVLTVQGDPAGTPVPISGNITASSAAVGPTGAAVPADADYIGYSVAGTLTGATGTANGLKVDGSAVTQPVSGTVTANAGTGTFAVSGTVTANAGTGTLAVSAASLPLPSGAATLAKQPALGVAGTASSDVITVQGISGMTALKVDGSGVTQPVSGTVTANAGSGTFTVSGTVTANAGTGTFTTDQTTSAATFQDGAIAFGALTTNFATVVTTGGVVRWLGLRNNTNAVVVVSLDGGSTTAFTLDSGDEASIDLKVNGRSIATSTALQAKYSGSAPTSGSIRVNVMY